MARIVSARALIKTMVEGRSSVVPPVVLCVVAVAILCRPCDEFSYFQALRTTTVKGTC